MSAFSERQYGVADRLFAHFVRDFPSDARAEDAMFLRAECRSRLGDKAGAVLFARRYLDAYPNGLRRPEAKRLAGEP
jgi:TolA-binding protein